MTRTVFIKLYKVLFPSDKYKNFTCLSTDIEILPFGIRESIFHVFIKPQKIFKAFLLITCIIKSIGMFYFPNKNMYYNNIE